jgi:hypothetical protein
MFTRLLSHLQMRRSTAFLLARADERLLDDIGLSRADLEAMRLGLDGARNCMPAPPPFRRDGCSLPCPGRDSS